jgi:hypothetical protein
MSKVSAMILVPLAALLFVGVGLSASHRANAQSRSALSLYKRRSSSNTTANAIMAAAKTPTFFIRRCYWFDSRQCGSHF